MTMEHPKLRYGLEALPMQHEGQNMILLRDRMGHSSDSLLLSPVVAELVIRMDGTNSFRDLQALFLRMTGEMLYTETLDEIVQKLDQNLFLENARFIDHVARQVARYRDDPVRRMRHAGQSYPSDAELLNRRLEGFFSTEDGGPGLPGAARDNRPVLGLVAPHIDIQAGGRCFAHAYKAAADSVSPRTWIVLGTGHELVSNYFALTAKDFETPLGLVGHDEECCAHLVNSAKRDILAGEYNHVREHTVEFQAVFLAYVQPGAKIVPLLCSFSHEDLETDGGYIDHFAGLLRDLVLTRSVGILASVDLAHIGPRYGDRFQPTDSTVKDHMASDRGLVESLRECDAEAFIRQIRLEGNRRKICGVAPLYVLAQALSGLAQGRLLDHTHVTVDPYGSFVTFASMIFHGTQASHGSDSE